MVDLEATTLICATQPHCLCTDHEEYSCNCTPADPDAPTSECKECHEPMIRIERDSGKQIEVPNGTH